MSTPTTTATATPTAAAEDPLPLLARERAVATLVVAFGADPIIRWLLPDATRFLTHFPELLSLAADVATTGGRVDVTGRSAGAAIWHAPGVALDDDLVGGLVEASLDAQRLEDAFGLLEQMARCHPAEPHWYLPFIGVDPSLQGRGHGSDLLAQGLARCDRDRLPAYLEASSPRNRRLYERHGFEAVAEIRSADSPLMWPMLRPAR